MAQAAGLVLCLSLILLIPLTIQTALTQKRPSIKELKSGGVCVGQTLLGKWLWVWMLHFTCSPKMKSLQAGSQQAGFGHAYPSPSVSQASEIFLWQTSGFTQEPAELICSGTEKGQVKSRANNNPKPEPGKGQASTSTLSIQLEKQNLGRGLQRITKIFRGRIILSARCHMDST